MTKHYRIIIIPCCTDTAWTLCFCLMFYIQYSWNSPYFCKGQFYLVISSLHFEKFINNLLLLQLCETGNGNSISGKWYNGCYWKIYYIFFSVHLMCYVSFEVSWRVSCCSLEPSSRSTCRSFLINFLCWYILVNSFPRMGNGPLCRLLSRALLSTLATICFPALYCETQRWKLSGKVSREYD